VIRILFSKRGNLLLAELLKLLGIGKFSKDDEESSLKEGRVLCKLLNGVASVLEHTLVSIDVRNLGDL